MAQKSARMLFYVMLVLLGLCLTSGAPGTPPGPADGAPPALERVVFLAHDLSPENQIVLSAAVASSPRPGVVLLDSAKATAGARSFLAAFHAEKVIPIGSFADGLTERERQLDVSLAPAVVWSHGPPEELWQLLYPRAEQVVVCPAEPRGLLLQATCLAGAAQAPLYVVHGDETEVELLCRSLAHWQPRKVFAIGTAIGLCHDLHKGNILDLKDESAVAAAHRQCLKRVETIVVANPGDVAEGLGGMSTLAPWIALQHRAALVLTNDAGDNVEAAVQQAIDQHHLKGVDTLILVAGLKAIPMKVRANPIPGDKDAQIEMEPFTPAGLEPYTFAIGRLFHEDPATVTLMLARQRLLFRDDMSPRKALVVSDAGGGLPLLEMFSRNTAQELRNAGFETTALFGKDVTRDELRRLLPEHQVFLWEGHHNTLIRDWGMPEWNEPLPPSLAFLQSCLALHEWKAQPLLTRGAIGVVGTSTRTYSASGGATSLAFFDALLYEHQSLGGALRQAKNFLVAYAQLKEKRLGKDAHRTGANLRSAWAFTLWGDPTLKLPLPETPAGALPPVRHEVHGNTITLSLPETPLDKVLTPKYQVQMWPNARLAGLIRKDKDDEGQPLVPFLFAEIALPHAPADLVPQLHGRLPTSHYVFCWDQRRRCGYLLVTPRSKDREDLRFHIDWSAASSMEDGPVVSGK